MVIFDVYRTLLLLSGISLAKFLKRIAPKTGQISQKNIIQ